MSDAPEDDFRLVAAKLAAYAHLLPRVSPRLQAKMDSANPGPVLPPPEAAVAPALPGPDWPAPDEDAARDRALGCLLGLAVGDAVGTTLEFTARDSQPPLTDMVGGGPFALAPGEWTDDTTMALCLAESLLAEGELDQEDLMARFRRWLERGENTVKGHCFDIGITTRAAIERYIAGSDPAAGSYAPEAAGNGSLVRLAPLAIFRRGDRRLAEQEAVKQSRTTHAAPEVLDACKLFTSMLIDALTGADRYGATRQRVMALSPKVLFISAGEYKAKPRAAIRATGYVVHTLEAALWAVWETENFRDAVLLAANLGEDADSVAAVAGQLAGALYGASGIPATWRAKLAQGERIAALAEALFEKG
ncbi:ADP-ribosylglycohydrolase family protein [Siccirubricoccus phaeus]|uniref:ADP-ribosylglycohydrolase family protein n=1 Tax=Siccirubricoccus phaeus TaxID=2595053 RepID=UPI0011F11EC8|nr:ADP-ribosylglycohydrolase family protein [Siccirubricoccus phaeus]